MPVFAKKENCPTSVELSDLATGERTPANIAKLRWHLTFCDFCAAEFGLYLRFPPEEETIEPTPIPKHLFELAESILKRKRLRVFVERRATGRH
jgi:hypothetical protein